MGIGIDGNHSSGLSERYTYTIDELIVSVMARQIRDDDVVIVGFATPMAAVAAFLARAIHAPGATLVYGGAVNPDIHDIWETTVRPERLGTLSYGFVDHLTVLDQIQRGRFTVQFLSPAEIDRQGNINTSLIGDYQKPKVRFPGALATSDVMVMVGRIVLYRTTHEARAFPEKVAFTTGAGHLERGEWRSRLGIRGKGPDKLITDLGVFIFDKRGDGLVAESLHPGVDPEAVESRTGFEVSIPEDVPTTVVPSGIEIEVLRNVIDPRGLRKLEFRSERESVLKSIIGTGTGAIKDRFP